MPKKTKKKYFTQHNQFYLSKTATAEVFRNSCAVVDDVEPRESFMYLKEIFKDKLDDDVIAMIFTECAYNVDLALETLMSLVNEENLENNSLHNASASLIIAQEDNILDEGKPEFSPFLNANSQCDKNSHNPLQQTTENLIDLEYSDNESLPLNFENFDNNLTYSNSYPHNRPQFNNPDDNSFTNTETDDTLSFLEKSSRSHLAHFSPAIDDISPYLEKVPHLESHTSSQSDSFSFSNKFENNHSNSSDIICQEHSETMSLPRFIMPKMSLSKKCTTTYSSLSKNFPCVNSYSSKALDYPFKGQHLSTNVINYCQQDFKSLNNLKYIIDKIKAKHKLLIILRGLPGSGKSSLGTLLKFSGVVYSTDDYFMKNGKYFFNFEYLGKAHEWNRFRTKDALEKGITPIIIDNTNTEIWEMTPYVTLGLKYDYEMHILEPNTPWKFNVKELAKRNKHNVSKEKISIMLERYQHNVTIDNIIKSLGSLNFDEKLLKLDNNQKIKKENILLEADVHQEEVPFEISNKKDQIASNQLQDSLPSLSDTFPNVGISSNSSEKNTIRADSSQLFEIQNENIENHLDKEKGINNLEELRVLMQEDSEESQSLSQHTSVSESTQDISGWEAITEHDNDFSWHKFTPSANKNDEEIKSEKIYSDDVISENSLNIIDKNITKEMNSEIDFPNFKKQNEGINFYVFNQKDNSFSSNNIQNESENLEIKNYHGDNDFNVCKNNNNINNDPKSYNICEENENTKNLSKDLAHDANINIRCIESNSSFNNLHLITDSTDNLKINNCNSNEENKPPLKENINYQTNNQLNSPKPPRNNKSKMLFTQHFKLNDDRNFSSFSPTAPEITDTNLSWDTNEFSLIENEINSNKELNLSATTNSEIPKPQRKTSNSIFKESNNALNIKALSLNNIRDLDETQSYSALDTNYYMENSENDVHKPKNRLCAKFDSLFINNTYDDNWVFPQYVKDDDFKPTFNEQINTTKISSQSQTEPNDFMLLHKIESEDVHLIDTEFKILLSRPKNDDECEIFSTTNPELNEISYTPLFEKSTCTDDIDEGIELNEKLKTLQECFPDICEEDLKHLLEMCHGDNNWLSNLLVEWGYMYNVTNQKSNISSLKNSKDEDFNFKYSENSCFNLNRNENKLKQKIDINYELIESKDSTSEETISDHLLAEINKTVSNSKAESSSETKHLSKLCLTLDPKFAYDLESMFGPISSCPDGNLPVNRRKVEISYDLAELIYQQWKNTVNHLDASYNLSFEKCPKSSNEKEASDFDINYIDNSCFLMNGINVNKENSNEPLPLKEIMDMEHALQLHKQEKLKKDSNAKREELYNKFPGADPLILDEIFEANNCSLEDSIKALLGNADYNFKEKKTSNKINNPDIKWDNLVFSDFINDDWSEWVHNGEHTDANELRRNDSSSLLSEDAIALREEAAHHYRLRQEAITKAQSAYCKGMKDVASFYAQQGDKHAQKFKAANRKASEIITQERNMKSDSLVLDLHGLYIQEAIPILDKFLRDKKLELRRRQQNTPISLTIITGKGKHSLRGAKLRPSVLEYLKKTAYGYTEIYPGTFEVNILPQ